MQLVHASAFVRAMLFLGKLPNICIGTVQEGVVPTFVVIESNPSPLVKRE